MQKNEQRDIIKIPLREILKSKGKTPSWLSRETGITKKPIYHIINHQRNPYICTVFKIAKALDMTIDELINFKP